MWSGTSPSSRRSSRSSRPNDACGNAVASESRDLPTRSDLSGDRGGGERWAKFHRTKDVADLKLDEQSNIREQLFERLILHCPAGRMEKDRRYLLDWKTIPIPTSRSPKTSWKTSLDADHRDRHGKVGERRSIRSIDWVALDRVVLTSREHVIALEARDKGRWGFCCAYFYEVRNSAEY
jgi:hypothetical protein